MLKVRLPKHYSWNKNTDLRKSGCIEMSSLQSLLNILVHTSEGETGQTASAAPVLASADSLGNELLMFHLKKAYD